MSWEIHCAVDFAGLILGPAACGGGARETYGVDDRSGACVTAKDFSGIIPGTTPWRRRHAGPPSHTARLRMHMLQGEGARIAFLRAGPLTYEADRARRPHVPNGSAP